MNSKSNILLVKTMEKRTWNKTVYAAGHKPVGQSPYEGVIILLTYVRMSPHLPRLGTMKEEQMKNIRNQIKQIDIVN